MPPCNLNLSIGKTVGYNNKILISNTDMKIGSSKDINKDHKKLLMSPPEPGKAERAVPKTLKGSGKPTKDHFAAQHEQVNN